MAYPVYYNDQTVISLAQTAWWKEWKDGLAHFREGSATFEEIRHKYEEHNESTIELPAWLPSEEVIKNANLSKLARITGLGNAGDIHRWSNRNKADFWSIVMQLLNFPFHEPFRQVFDPLDPENPQWFKGARLNVASACFNQPEPEKDAIIQQDENGYQRSVSYKELLHMVRKIAGALEENGMQRGDGIVIYMPFTIESVALYLGAIYGGFVAVSVADSFSAGELQKRIDISKAKLLVTCDGYQYGGKALHIGEKARKVAIDKRVIVPYLGTNLEEMIPWDEFFSNEKEVDPVYQQPESVTNILFSSGTTRDPKAIPWTQITPLKCAMDGFFHHDIHPDDVVTWTTGMGWMMAPWLIYATFLNKATMALYVGAHAQKGFIDFANTSKVSILGTIPSIVKGWERAGAAGPSALKTVRIFTSTGEPSNARDYLYLMSLSGFRSPIIEYCGGTEIGGGYITGSVWQAAAPSAFTTPALGLDFYLLDELSKPAEMGEVFLIPPSVGLSQTLLNRDHHEEYYLHSPQGPDGEVLRKHGDGFERVSNTIFNHYQSKGRTDDAMNIGGIKISAVEIETVIEQLDEVTECAAVSLMIDSHTTEKLIIFYVGQEKELKEKMQKVISSELNPLFRIHDVVRKESLPRTASNKVMRRVLRKNYRKE